jgi:uncharacterized hydrophobic protein (TIGR00341 family)
MKIIEILTDAGYQDTIEGIAEHFNADVWFGPTNEDGRISARMLVQPEERQNVLDDLQDMVVSSPDSRILILPVEAVLPKENEDVKPDEKQKKPSSTITREEIFSQVEKGAQFDNNFFLLVILSSIVASIGLLENNIAVIVGAMVIAPLLGPNIAFALGTALGEKELIWQSLKAIISGVSLAVLVAVLIGFIWPLPMESPELLLRTDANYSGTAIALASGAAAALSLISGVSGVLVGVMVAVALMPPAVTIGLMLSTGAIELAFGACLLLAVNIVCINLSAKLVFLIKGIRPRTWLEARKARQSQQTYLLIWLALLLLLILIIFLRRSTS